MFCIIANALLLASKEYRDYYDPNYKSVWNEVLAKVDLGFSFIFMIECLSKIIVMGFVMHKRAYLRDAWNRLDFLIVLISLVNLVPAANNEALKSLRTARTLRPLRSIGALKSVKLLIENMIKSIPGLFNVCVFLCFVIGIFAIFGTLSFMGKQYNFCRLTEELIDDGVNQPYWPINPDAEWLCSTDEMCSGAPNNLGPGVVAKCGNIYETYGLDPQIYDKTNHLDIIKYDVTNFNNVINSILTVFQIVTLEGWANLLYIYSDSTGYFIASMYFVLVIVLGSFISINLVLAQIMHSFLQTESEQ